MSGRDVEDGMGFAGLVGLSSDERHIERLQSEARAYRTRLATADNQIASLLARAEAAEKRLAELTTTLQLIGTAAVEAVKVKP